MPSTINAMDNFYNTPLGVAAIEGQARAVSFLLSAGAHQPAAWTPGIIKNSVLLSAVEKKRPHVVRTLLSQGLEAIGGVRLVPEALRSSIQRNVIGILSMLLNVEGEERQVFWANHPVFSVDDLITAKFRAGTPIARVHAVVNAKYGIPPLHYAVKSCSLRASGVLLSAGADETAVDTQGNRACDVVGDFQGHDERDPAKESGAGC